MLTDKQVSEEVERALAKLGPARLDGRFGKFLSIYKMLANIVKI